MDTDWLSKWFSDIGQKPFTTIYVYYNRTPPDISLAAILSLKDEDLKPFGREMLELTQSHDLPADLDLQLEKLRWGIRAYFEFQDVLWYSTKLEPTMMLRSNRHYCYFESLVYLRESAVCLLDRNILASVTLLRPFLELSILHLYWHLYGEKSGYETFYAWLKENKPKPGFDKSLRYVFENLPCRGYIEATLLQQRKTCLEGLYGRLCAYNHTPKLEESVAAKGSGLGTTAYQTMFDSVSTATDLLHHLILLFVTTYPMALFPVDRLKKWGFGGPVGIYFDEANFRILETYLGSDTVATLKRHLESTPEVRQFIEWYEEFPDLTDDEVEATWQDWRSSSSGQESENLPERLCMFKSFHRVLNWVNNYSIEKMPDQSEIDKINTLARIAASIDSLPSSGSLKH